MEISHVIRPLIERYDVDSSVGCSILQPRSNLLVDVSAIQLWEDTMHLKINQWIPEGSGTDRFWGDAVTVPGDSPCDSDLTLVWDVQRALPPLHTKLWFLQICEDATDVRTFYFDDQSEWGYVTPPQRSEVFHHLELFCGGMGGWTSMLDMLFDMKNAHTQSIGIELDLNTAFVFAMNQTAALIKPVDRIPFDFDRMYQGNWVICDDVLSWK